MKNEMLNSTCTGQMVRDLHRTEVRKGWKLTIHNQVTLFPLRVNVVEFLSVQLAIWPIFNSVLHLNFHNICLFSLQHSCEFTELWGRYIHKRQSQDNDRVKINIRTRTMNADFFFLLFLHCKYTNKKNNVCKFTLKRLQIHLDTKYLMQVLYSCYEFDLLMPMSAEI